MKEKQADNKVNFTQMLQLIQVSKLPQWMIALVIILTLTETAAGLIVPWFTKNAIDVMTIQNLDILTVSLLAGAFLVQAIASGFGTYFLSYLGERIVANLRKRLWNKTLTMPVSYFDLNRSGETISRINNDTAVFKELIVHQLVTVFSGIISLIASVCILFYLDWMMTLVMLVIMPVIFLIVRPMGKKMYEISKRMQGRTAEFTSVLSQVVSEIRLVKSYVAEPVERKHGEKTIDSIFNYGLKEARVVAIIQPLMTFMMTFMLVLVIGYGGYRVATGILSAGELVAYILYLFQIIMPIGLMARFFTSVQKALGASERLTEILEHKEEPAITNGPTVNPKLPIFIEDVHFAYHEKDPVIHKLNFTIHPGKITAIVGPSGSGKTTLFSLIERFYEPNAGSIRLGDTPITQFSLRDWRSNISYVSQESPLLAGTIRENICYGMEKTVTDEALLQAAKRAYADEFILELPQGFDTEVGERGIMLSGGQRQRIAIARALLHDPQILMLDEATSNLDSSSEQVVQEALHNLMQGRTTLVIAHRLSTVVDADQIIILEKGALTGMGTHDELLLNHELYQQLVQQQFKWELQP